MLERFPEIVRRLAEMAERFCTMLICVGVAFIADDKILDRLLLPS